MTTVTAMDFGMQVWNALNTRDLRGCACKLWENDADRDDGVMDTVAKALANARRFDGRNLVAWLSVIMGNVRRDQRAKGYKKGTKPLEGDRLVYAGHYDYAAHVACLCDPEAILIATEGRRL